MSAEPPPTSPQLLPQLNNRPERQWPLPLARQRPQTFLMGRAESEDAASSADILRKLRMTSHPATSSDTINNGSIASGKAESISRLHPPLTTHRKRWHPRRSGC